MVKNTIMKHDMEHNPISGIWAGLKWTSWVSINAYRSEFKTFAKSSGVYRIKDTKSHYLAYIGQTGRNLRERLQDLARNILKDKMPFNDPHTAAPNLWVWRTVEGIEFEISVAAASLSRQHLRGLEDSLLWRHRLTTGMSTLCNYGKFHENYYKSGPCKSGKRGGGLSEDKINAAGGKSTIPLKPLSTPDKNDWMSLRWSDYGKPKSMVIPDGSGIYRFYHFGLKRVMYVGESDKLQSRIKNHLNKEWLENNVLLSFYHSEDLNLPFHRHEYESDLLGWYYCEYNEPPIKQYGGSG
ncbi:MAG TPA: hypothetical protein VMW42_02380 [Desulfatiglandales bacterium]|nr:hypothetical protein [Desulfatiglandales bacterium]